MNRWCARCGRGTDDVPHVKYCGAGDDKDFGHDNSLTERPTRAGIGVGDVWVNTRGRRFEVIYFSGTRVMVWDGQSNHPESAIPELMTEANGWSRETKAEAK
jgi:hypothetical protein